MSRSIAKCSLTALALGLLVAWTAPATAQAPPPFRSRYSGPHAQDPGRCAIATSTTRSTMYMDGTGIALHIGSVRVKQDHCVDLGGPDPLAFTDGQFTITAPDGDKLTGTYSGHLQPAGSEGMYYLDGTFSITGGTGRFMGASGGGATTGLTDLGTSQIELEGILKFPSTIK